MTSDPREPAQGDPEPEGEPQGEPEEGEKDEGEEHAGSGADDHQSGDTIEEEDDGTTEALADEEAHPDPGPEQQINP